MGLQEIERQAYLARVAAAARHTDWMLLAYALMSNHIHWAAVAGTAPLERFVKPLHGGFALWLNRTHGTLGPVFAHRPKSIAMPPDDGARLLAYIHNNPVRAHVVSDPMASPWTSHRAYLGLAQAPPWLAVEHGLQLCGFDATPPGRQAFHRFVCAQAGALRDPVLSGDGLARTRAQVRSHVGAPVELSSAQLQAPGQPSHWVLAPPDTPLRPRWQGSRGRW